MSGRRQAAHGARGRAAYSLCALGKWVWTGVVLCGGCHWSTLRAERTLHWASLASAILHPDHHMPPSPAVPCRTRTAPAADQQAALDAVVARLGPYFNDPWVLKAAVAAAAAASATSEAAASAEAGGGAAPELAPLDDSSTAAQERLDQMYDPIGFLVQDSVGRAEAFVAQIREALEEQRRRGGEAAEARWAGWSEVVRAAAVGWGTAWVSGLAVSSAVTS